MSYPKNLPAKPTVLDETAQRLILNMIAAGNYMNVSLRAAGVSEDTYYRWKKLHEEGAESAKPFADFFESIQKASALAEASALAVIRSGEPGWQGSAWFLERRFPRKWNRKVVYTIPSSSDPNKLSDKELEAFIKGF